MDGSVRKMKGRYLGKKIATDLLLGTCLVMEKGEVHVGSCKND